MSDEKLRGELLSLFRFGAKPPRGPGLKLSQEEYEALISRLQALKEQVEDNNRRLARILGEEE